jgi:hypothetical protein
MLPFFMLVMGMQGILDSDSLPLNVSREMLQQHASLKTIKKKLVRKALDMIRHIADEDPDEKLEAEESSKAIAALKSHSFLTVPIDYISRSGDQNFWLRVQKVVLHQCGFKGPPHWGFKPQSHRTMDSHCRVISNIYVFFPY